jgi:hypothetical protein
MLPTGVAARSRDYLFNLGLLPCNIRLKSTTGVSRMEAIQTDIALLVRIESCYKTVTILVDW